MWFVLRAGGADTIEVMTLRSDWLNVGGGGSKAKASTADRLRG